ncbi:MAG: hypothetical protein UU01_C0025G0001 [Parcubacteria group bacterium GW2011_GWA2_40_37]|nr:MAG: hypothetical protein UU01_C0025G0001 [Parcubacteria group bacterium GW2011_GWA2_40_37]
MYVDFFAKTFCTRVQFSSSPPFGKVRRKNGRTLPRNSEEWVAKILARFAGASEFSGWAK